MFAGSERPTSSQSEQRRSTLHFSRRVQTRVVSLDAQNHCRVHSSVVRAADCRSAGPWFKSGCALHCGRDHSDPNTSGEHNWRSLPCPSLSRLLCPVPSGAQRDPAHAMRVRLLHSFMISALNLLVLSAANKPL